MLFKQLRKIFGVTFGPNVQTSLEMLLPTASQALNAIGFGASEQLTGTIAWLGWTSISGVTFNSSSGTTGTVTLPAITQVKTGRQFGSGGNQFTGNVTLPTANVVLTSNSYGAAGTEFSDVLLRSHQQLMY